jgi:hypothetical protein
MHVHVILNPKDGTLIYINLSLVSTFAIYFNLRLLRLT